MSKFESTFSGLADKALVQRRRYPVKSPKAQLAWTRMRTLLLLNWCTAAYLSKELGLRRTLTNIYLTKYKLDLERRVGRKAKSSDPGVAPTEYRMRVH